MVYNGKTCQLHTERTWTVPPGWSSTQDLFAMKQQCCILIHCDALSLLHLQNNFHKPHHDTSYMLNHSRGTVTVFLTAALQHYDCYYYFYYYYQYEQTLVILSTISHRYVDTPFCYRSATVVHHVSLVSEQGSSELHSLADHQVSSQSLHILRALISSHKSKDTQPEACMCKYF